MHGEFLKWLPWDRAKKDGLVQIVDPRQDYLGALEHHVDIEAIRKGEIRVVMDPLYGTSRGYLDDFFRNAGAKMALLHYWRDPYLGGLSPEPTSETTQELQETVKWENAHLGLATEWSGGIGRSVATTHLIDLIDHVAGQYRLNVRETPVGFKFLGELLAKEEILMGNEESTGMSILGHVPENDGILACLLVAEMVATTKASLKDLIDDLFRRVDRSLTDGRMWR